MECYCVARNKPIRREITKPQTATVISLWFWGLLTCPELYCDWPVHNQHSWNFSGVHGFLSLTGNLSYLKHIFFFWKIKLLLFKNVVFLDLSCYWLPGCGEIAFFLTVAWLAWSPRLGPNTPTTELFSKKKNHVLLSNFFSSSNMSFIRLFLAITWKKSGVTVLVSSQTAVKSVHGFENAVRMESLRSGDWDEIQNKAHRVRSMHSRSSLFSVVFIYLISPTQRFILG